MVVMSRIGLVMLFCPPLLSVNGGYAIKPFALYAIWHAGFEERRVYLKQGLALLNRLQNEGHLPPNQNWSNRFEEVLTGQDAATED